MIRPNLFLPLASAVFVLKLGLVLCICAVIYLLIFLFKIRKTIVCGLFVLPLILAVSLIEIGRYVGSGFRN